MASCDHCFLEYTPAAVVEGGILAAVSVCMACAFLSGVSQMSLSTPGVFLPWFSVTRLTARALPLNEWVSRRCKALTLPHLPSCVAL